MSKKYFPVFVVLLLALCQAAWAQRPLSSSGDKQKNLSPKTAEGVLYFVGSGNQITECLLQTAHGALNFSVVEKTKLQGFDPQSDDDPAWHPGARWKVVYRGGGGKDPHLTADSVVYLGKVDSVDAAQQTAYDFLNSLASGKFEDAYEMLSPDVRQNLNFGAFSEMYRNVSVDMRGRLICSHTDESVKLLLAPHGADGGDLFQPAEIRLVNGKWLIGRLGSFRETTAGCGDSGR